MSDATSPMPRFQHASTLLLALTLAACRASTTLESHGTAASSATAPTSGEKLAPTPAGDAGDERSRAIHTARACAARDESFRTGVGRTPLLYDAARISSCESCGSRIRVLSIPEERPTTKPAGLDLYVDLGTGMCTHAPMD